MGRVRGRVWVEVSRRDAETQRGCLDQQKIMCAAAGCSLMGWGATHWILIPCQEEHNRSDANDNARPLRLTVRLFGGLNAVDDTACAFWQANGTHLVPGVEFFFSPAT